MPPQLIFLSQLILGYVAWALLFGTYILPWFRSMSPIRVHRVIATLHSFRFFGLTFLVTGVTGNHLPSGFAQFAAYGDLAAGVLALLALCTFQIRPLFWTFTVAFNLVGAMDLALNYVHANRLHLAPLSGELGAMYWIPVLCVPLLMITHGAAAYWLLRFGVADSTLTAEMA